MSTTRPVLSVDMMSVCCTEVAKHLPYDKMVDFWSLGIITYARSQSCFLDKRVSPAPVWMPFRKG